MNDTTYIQHNTYDQYIYILNVDIDITESSGD